MFLFHSEKHQRHKSGTIFKICVKSKSMYLVIIYVVQTYQESGQEDGMFVWQRQQCFTPECEDNKSTLERSQPE